MKTKRRILFASGDVGGARAILPVVDRAIARGHDVAVVRNGHIAGEGAPGWRWVDPAECTFAGIKQLQPDIVVFGTSVKDKLALSAARHGHAVGAKTIHVLDNWASYTERLRDEDKPPFVPQHYLVPDDVAFKAAQAQGVPTEILSVTGTPALEPVINFYKTQPSRTANTATPYRILFISEPAESDQGASDASPAFRGYTEKTVLKMLCDALQPEASSIELDILPHPREDAAKVRATWDAVRGRLRGSVLSGLDEKVRLTPYDAAAGMASILLYEAWLISMPTLSLQPGLRIPALGHFAARRGLHFAGDKQSAPEKIAAWLQEARQLGHIQLRDDAALHASATNRIMQYLEE